jgi:hypothetical protein
MMAQVPALPLPDDLTDRIAKEIAALVVDHIELMYPNAARAVAWKSCSLSVQGVVRNAVSSAGKAAETGTADNWIAASKRNRRSVRKAQINTPATE